VSGIVFIDIAISLSVSRQNKHRCKKLKGYMKKYPFVQLLNSWVACQFQFPATGNDATPHFKRVYFFAGLRRCVILFKLGDYK